MAIPELQQRQIRRDLQAYCDDIPVHARHQVRLGFSMSSSSIELFEERPPWDAPQKPWIKHPVAKFRFVATGAVWKLYCIRRDQKWHRYELLPSASRFDTLLAEVEEDPICIFWG